MLVVVVVINVLSTERGSNRIYLPMSSYSSSTGGSLTRRLRGDVGGAYPDSKLMYNTFAPRHTHIHIHKVVFKTETKQIDFLCLGRALLPSFPLVTDYRCQICFYNCHVSFDARFHTHIQTFGTHTHSLSLSYKHTQCQKFPIIPGSIYIVLTSPSSYDFDIDLPSTARQSITYTYKHHHLYIIPLCCE